MTTAPPLSPVPRTRRVRRGFVIALGLVASTAALVTAQRAWLYHETRLMDEIVQRLHAAGEPVPNFPLDTSLAALEKPDAIRYYLAAAQLVVFDGLPAVRDRLLAIDGRTGQLTAVEPSEEVVQAARRFLDRNREAIDLAEQAANLDARRYNPYDTHLRGAPDLLLRYPLSVHTLLSARTGTAASAVDAAVVELRALRLGETGSRWSAPAFLLAGIVTAAADVAVVLGRPDLSGSDLARLSGELARPEPGDLVAREFAYERALALDEPDPTAGWLEPLALRERRRYAELLGAIVDAAGGPEGQRLTAIENLVSPGFSTVLLPSRDSIPPALVISRVRPLTLRMLSNVAIGRAALTATAIARYRRDHGGAMPASIDALTPAYLAHAPLDPVTGTPLLVRAEPDGYVVYSVGDNRTDDGGRITPTEPLDQGRPDRAPDWGVRVRRIPPPTSAER